MSFIEIQNARKGYGPAGARTEVLGDINLAVEEGEFVVIVGYSGSGKSTLINLISGLVQPDAGQARIDGQPITGPGPDRGLVFQNYSLLPWLTVEENVALAVDEVFRGWPAARRREHVAKYIAMVKLGHAAHKFPRELSGGMRQRVSLARTLAMNPRVLLLDEPLSALDALTRYELQEVLLELWRRNRVTTLMVTHDVDEAIFLSDRVVMMTDGPEAEVGDILHIPFERPRSRREIMEDPRYYELRERLITFLNDRSHIRPSREPGFQPSPDMAAEMALHAPFPSAAA